MPARVLCMEARRKYLSDLIRSKSQNCRPPADVDSRFESIAHLGAFSSQPAIPREMVSRSMRSRIASIALFPRVRMPVEYLGLIHNTEPVLLV